MQRRDEARRGLGQGRELTVWGVMEGQSEGKRGGCGGGDRGEIEADMGEVGEEETGHVRGRDDRWGGGEHSWGDKDEKLGPEMPDEQWEGREGQRWR